MSEPTSMEKMLSLANEFDRRQTEITNLRSINSDLLEALEAAEKALTSLPNSWGFEFTDLPKIRAALKKAKP